MQGKVEGFLNYGLSFYVQWIPFFPQLVGFFNGPLHRGWEGNSSKFEGGKYIQVENGTFFPHLG